MRALLYQVGLTYSVRKLLLLFRWKKFSRLEPYNAYYAPRVNMDSVVSLISEEEILGTNRSLSRGNSCPASVRRQNTLTSLRKLPLERRSGIFLQRATPILPGVGTGDKVVHNIAAYDLIDNIGTDKH